MSAIKDCDRSNRFPSLAGYWIVDSTGIAHEGVDSSDWADLENPLVFKAVYGIRQKGRFVTIKQLAILQKEPVEKAQDVNKIPFLGVLENRLNTWFMRAVDSITTGSFWLELEESDSGKYNRMDGAYTTSGIVVDNEAIVNANAFQTNWTKVSKRKALHVIKKIEHLDD